MVFTAPAYATGATFIEIVAIRDLNFGRSLGTQISQTDPSAVVTAREGVQR